MTVDAEGPRVGAFRQEPKPFYRASSLEHYRSGRVSRGGLASRALLVALTFGAFKVLNHGANADHTLDVMLHL